MTMRKYALVALLATACASPPPPTCPKCYSIDEVAPYEPPQRMIILCDEPVDAGVTVDDGGEFTGPVPF